MNRKKSGLQSLMGAVLLAGCSTLPSTEAGNVAPAEASGTSGAIAARVGEEQPILARGALPGADLSRDAFSRDGNWITFCSQDSTLVDGDSNGLADVYLYNRSGNYFVRASLSASGLEPNAPCWRASSSANGRYVVFDSAASNLVAGDTNNRSDVFVKDRYTGQITLVSTATSGPSNGSSDQAVISDDGLYVAFCSAASNLVVGDTNRVNDVFVRDLQNNTTQIVSKSGATLANRPASNPSISNYGRYISFECRATNLATSQGQPISGGSQIYVADRQLNLLNWVSRGPAGQEVAGDSYSAYVARNGGYVAFVSKAQLSDTPTTREQIYRSQVAGGVCQLATEPLPGDFADGDCRLPVLSPDGNWISFLSRAQNLVNGKTDLNFDVFVKNFSNGAITRHSNPNGANDASIEQLAADTPFFTNAPVVAFRSLASTIVGGNSDGDGDDDLFIDRAKQGSQAHWCFTNPQSTSRIGESYSNDDTPAASSQDGHYVAFVTMDPIATEDTNGTWDVYVLDRKTGRNELISQSNSGVPGNASSGKPSISGDGRFVVFETTSNNLVAGATLTDRNIYLRDRQAGVTSLVSRSTAGAQASGLSYWPHISQDGNFITFSSLAANLVPGDTNGKYDVFLFERALGQTRRVSVANGGAQANDHSFRSSISADGRYVAYESDATNLGVTDTNGVADIYLADLLTGQRSRVSVDGVGGQLAGDSAYPILSASGRRVLYISRRIGSPAGPYDLFVRDLDSGQVNQVNVAVGGGPANAGYVSGDGIAKLSSDGNRVAFVSTASNLVSADTNGSRDVFVRDLVSAQTTRANLNWKGLLAEPFSFRAPSFSGDGRFLFFYSGAFETVVPERSNSISGDCLYCRRL